jgi:hypothetical protein
MEAHHPAEHKGNLRVCLQTLLVSLGVKYNGKLGAYLQSLFVFLGYLNKNK